MLYTLERSQKVKEVEIQIKITIKEELQLFPPITSFARTDKSMVSIA